MYLIVGLGNPEPEYSNTRHNMGFDVINKLAKKYEIDINREKFNAIYGTGIIEGEKVILVKPQTYMNLSGKSIKEFFNFYKIQIDKLIVIYDDMDIEKAEIKIRKKGGPGNHNGMKSIVHELINDNFPRIRVGIGKPMYAEEKINYVIGKIPKEESVLLETGVDKAVIAIQEVLRNGIDIAMNRYN